MVYYFSSLSDPSVVIYMGKDKHENEFLIKYAQHHDIWFHVDNLSSAHVYLRTKEAITSYDQVSKELINECSQLTKANSIEGCKKASVAMNMTWATNLLKTHDMQTGAVSYKTHKKVRHYNVDKDKDIVRAIMKTKYEAFPDFEKDYRDYLKELEQAKNAENLKVKIAEEEEEKAGKAVKQAKKAEWDDFFGQAEDDEKVYAGGNNEYLEDDFM